MELYQINYLIIIIIGVIFLLRQNNKKETFENLDTFIKNTNNGKWNFSTYNPYSNLNDYSNMFIFTYTNYNNTNPLTYNENLFHNQKTLKKIDEEINLKGELYNYIIKLLNKYNDSTNQVVITKHFFNNKGLQLNYNVKLINAYDKLNYIKNKTKLNNLINTHLIKDLISFYINKHIYITEDTVLDTQYEDKDNLVVQLDYKTDTDINEYLNYIPVILKKIKEYLKMDIIDNGTVIKNSNNKSLIKFKVITYLLDDNDREVLNNKITKLHKMLFNQLLNTNDNNNILRKLKFNENELENKLENVLGNICIYRSGLCKKNVSEDIPTPKCSVKTQEKNILNTFEIKPDENCTDKNWKNHIITNLNDYYKSNCNKFDIDYNLLDNKTYELNIYSEVGNSLVVENVIKNKLNTDKCTFNVTKKNEESLNICNFNESENKNIDDIENYMKEIEKIKGIDQNTMNNIKSVLLSKIEVEKFNPYIRNKKNKDKDKLRLLRAFGKVFKFLEIISTLDNITDTIKEDLNKLEELENDITKNKLTAILFYIINKHIKNNNNEFKLNDKTDSIKRHKFIRMYIEENYEILLEKLLIMNTSEKVELLDNSKTDYDNVVLELEMIEKMSNTQLSIYFLDINEIFPNKDVNDRLKIITNHNSESSLRIHKKLNQLQGGFKLLGGNNDKPINGNIYRIRNKLFPQRHIYMNEEKDAIIKHSKTEIKLEEDKSVMKKVEKLEEKLIKINSELKNKIQSKNDNELNGGSNNLNISDIDTDNLEKTITNKQLYQELKDYELGYLLDINVVNAFKYLNKIDKIILTVNYLHKMYKLGKINELIEFLSFYSDDKRIVIESSLINKLEPNDRQKYIQNYFKKVIKNKSINVEKKIDENIEIEEEELVEEEKNIIEQLKLKLDNMKIEKEILNNQYKIEQQNRVFEEQLNKKKNKIDKLDEKINKASELLEKSKKNKSKSFFRKIMNFFFKDEQKITDELKAEIKNDIIKDESDKIKNIEEINKQNLDKIEQDRKLKIKQMKKKNEEKLEKIRKENQKILNEQKIKDNENKLKLKTLEQKQNKSEVDELFNKQDSLIRKHTQLLKIIKKVNTLPPKMNEEVTDNNEEIIMDNNLIESEIIEEESMSRVKLVKSKPELKISFDINEPIKQETKEQKNNEKCLNYIDCYFKSLDDRFYTSYKKDYTFIKDAQLPKQKKPVCKSRNDCPICHLNTSGVPESIHYNKIKINGEEKNKIKEKSENTDLNTNVNTQDNLQNSDSQNDYFNTDYEGVPDCPFDTCMSCDNNKYKLIDNAYPDKLIKKYRVD